MRRTALSHDDNRMARVVAPGRDPVDRPEIAPLRPRSWRLAAVAIVGLAHFGALLLLVRRVPARVAPPIAAMVVHNIALPPSAPVPLPPPRRATPLAVSTSAPEVAVVPSSPPVVATCGVVAALTAAIGSDLTAITALAPVAADARRAVMVWDGGWSGRAADDPLRRVIAATLPGQRADCLDEVQTGPRLLLVPVGPSMVAVAIGSGTWRWRGLLSDDHDSTPGAGVTLEAEK